MNFKKIFSVALSAALIMTNIMAVSAAPSPSPNPTVPIGAIKPLSRPIPKFSPAPIVPKTEINIAALKGPTAMGMVKLMSDNENGKAKNDYNFEIDGTPDDIVAKITKGELDIAAVPCNLASVLYNKTNGKIKVAAVNTLGVLYLVDTTGAIKNISDLKGKTIYSVGKGTTPEFALNYVLNQNGLVPQKDVKIEYKSEATELAALLAIGEADVAMLPEPYVTTVLAKNDKVKIALNLTEEWNKVQEDYNLVTGTIIVRTEFLEKNKAAFDAFLSEYKSSVEYVNKNNDAAAALVGKYEIAPEAVAKKAISRCNIVFITGDKMKTDISGYLGVLFDAEPKSIGGKLPDDSFYYKK